MFTTNPFAELSASISPTMMQYYVILMVLLVIGGTILDTLHKKSAKYFFENAKHSAKGAKKEVTNKAGMVIKTVTNEVLTSSEFSNPKRRMSHLLTMYGFIIFVATTAIMIFAYPAARGDATPAILPILWHLGALMLAIGGYWFWFFIRVDVTAEAKKWYQLTPRADLFIVSLLAMSTFALLWSFTKGHGLFLVLFILASTVLFSTVLWSKFAHMFFKPAAAYEKRVTWASGAREGLPDMPDLTDAAIQERFPDIPEYMGKNPVNMGPGIKREEPHHY